MTAGPTPPWPGREESLLCDLCAFALGTRTGTPSAPAETDWPRFLALARRQRVEGLVWRALDRGGRAGVPETVRDAMRAAAARNTLASLKLVGHQARIAGALAASGIASIPLKGVCLSALYYGDPAVRSAGDIDFLLPEEKMAQADAVIRSLGYQRISAETHEPVPAGFQEDPDVVRHLNYASADDVLVEAHVRLHKNPALMPVSVDEIASKGRTLPLAGQSLPMMSDALQFVFLSTHGARHTWKRLQWVCDIAAMLVRADGSAVGAWLAEAERLGLANPAAQGLALAHRLLATPLPDAAARRLSRSAALRFMVRRAERTIFASLEDQPDEPGGFNPAVRLYRLCLTSRPGYHWNELKRSAKVLAGRAMPTAGAG